MTAPVGEVKVDDPTLVFSMKESGFKCVYKSVGQFIDFTDVITDINLHKQCFSLSPSALAKIQFQKMYGQFDNWYGFWETSVIFEEKVVHAD